MPALWVLRNPLCHNRGTSFCCGYCLFIFTICICFHNIRNSFSTLFGRQKHHHSITVHILIFFNCMKSFQKSIILFYSVFYSSLNLFIYMILIYFSQSYIHANKILTLRVFAEKLRTELSLSTIKVISMTSFIGTKYLIEFHLLYFHYQTL